MQRPPVGRLLLLQLLILLLVSGAWLLESGVSARSALLGGFAYFIPNSVFTLRFFRRRGARQAQALYMAMMAGVMVKLVTTCFLFAGVLLLIRPLSGPALFAGVGAMILSQMLTPFIFSRVVHR